MVSLVNGRFILPNNLYYDKEQHVFYDMEKKLIGLDQLGYDVLEKPVEINFLVSDKIKMGEPFVHVKTSSKTLTLTSPCSGTIKKINSNILQNIETDTYTEGFFIECAIVDEVNPKLITGEAIIEWGKAEAKKYLPLEFNYKVVIIGDSGTSKTTLRIRYTDGMFKHECDPTIGVDFGSKEIMIPIPGDRRGKKLAKVKLTFWEIGGKTDEMERMMYLNQANGAVITYSVDNKASFENIEKYIDELDDNIGLDLPILILGNNADREVPEDQRVPLRTGKDYARKNKFLFAECSAKLNEGIEEIFHKFAKELLSREF